MSAVSHCNAVNLSSEYSSKSWVTFLKTPIYIYTAKDYLRAPKAILDPSIWSVRQEAFFTVGFYTADHQSDQATRRYLGKLTEFPQCMQSTE